jgi:hypothetical protein
MNPRVSNVKVMPNYMLEISFVGNEKKIFDVKPYLHYPIYNALIDTTFFNTAKAALGTVVWENDIDFCPDTLYIEGI